MNRVETVSCYLEQEDSYLMLYRNKRQKDMNQGKWIGVGGHIEEKETPEEALVREVLEETGFVLDSYQKRALLEFINDDYVEIIHLYTSSQFHGRIHSCDEGTLAWKKKNEIMQLNLWDGDRVFLKRMMEKDSYFEMRLYYENGKFIRSEEL